MNIEQIRKTRYYEDLNVLHENTMPNRAYYMPASRNMGTLTVNREQSDRVQFLNGEWKFRYFESIYDAQDNFFETENELRDFDIVQVPGVWQNAGYDSHQYTNIRYPIPLDPPYVPQENPCGEYVCEFSFVKNEQAPKTYLNFEGVDSCFYVWLNGKYVGYSQVSHATSEFDVTEMLVDGKNRLAVLVLKWCDGTYLEDQDKFRMSGIFRDVYLLQRPENAIFDYFTTTEIQGNCAAVKIRANYLGKMTATKVSLYDADGNLAAEGVMTNAEEDKDYPFVCTLYVTDPILWNPEQPFLYSLVLKTADETIVDRVGIREICIQNRIVYVNGKPIKFKGVNRHDSDPVTGFVISKEQLAKDLKMIKAHNFNAIRSSHYPNAPYFYQLCDEYGFLVIDEADNESHGTQTQYLKDNSWENVKKRWNERIADNPEFNTPVLDRVQLCVQRDKNRPCIVIWSMGNECAYGCAFEHALAWTKSFDPSRLTHYESALYRSDKRKYDFSNLDLHSRMYPSFEEVQEYLDSNPDKPYLLVEYCHAMGNGPGDLEDYFRYIDANDIMCGGFVWEWCDHAIYKGEASNGKAMYFYGGDHGEALHDGNFCMDGLVYPDRRPHTGLLEYQNVYRPARVTEWNQETGELTLKNHMNFVDLREYISVNYELNCDGDIVQEGDVEILNPIQPGNEGKLQLKVQIPETGKCYLKIYYHLKKSDALRRQGMLLGFDEILLQNADGRNRKAEQLKNIKIKQNTKFVVCENERVLNIVFNGFGYTFNKLTGLFDSLTRQDECLVEKPMEINIWRAPTDNDRILKLDWMDAHYDKTVTRAYETSWHMEEEQMVIKSRMSVSAASIQKILEIDAVWKVNLMGDISVSFDVKKDMEFPELPRFGLRIFLNEEMDNVTYYGMGPYESYIDKHHASSHGIYHAKVDDLHEDYLRPQENGSHTDCDYVVVGGANGRLSAVADKPFSFNVSHYTQEELTEKKHHFELEKSGYTVLCLDYAQNGIGSNSCGPVLSEAYQLNQERFTFEIKLIFEMR